jgi:hypothetical protein
LQGGHFLLAKRLLSGDCALYAPNKSTQKRSYHVRWRRKKQISQKRDKHVNGKFSAGQQQPTTETPDNKKLTVDNERSREPTPEARKVRSFVALVSKSNVQIKNASPSSAALLSRFEKAPEFVPGRRNHINSINPDNLIAPEPKPERLQVITVN